MKTSTRKTLSVALGLCIVLALGWMVYLMVSGSALAMTAIPASLICGTSGIGIAKLSEPTEEETTNVRGNHNSRAA